MKPPGVSKTPGGFVLRDCHQEGQGGVQPQFGEDGPAEGQKCSNRAETEATCHYDYHDDDNPRLQFLWLWGCHVRRYGHGLWLATIKKISSDYQALSGHSAYHQANFPCFLLIIFTNLASKSKEFYSRDNRRDVCPNKQQI